MARKKVLITGAAGFLGSHLCDRLVKDNYLTNSMNVLRLQIMVLFLVTGFYDMK